MFSVIHSYFLVIKNRKTKKKFSKPRILPKTVNVALSSLFLLYKFTRTLSFCVMHSECYGQEALRSFWRQFHLISSLAGSLHWLGHCTGWVIALAGSLHWLGHCTMGHCTGVILEGCLGSNHPSHSEKSTKSRKVGVGYFPRKN